METFTDKHVLKDKHLGGAVGICSDELKGAKQRGTEPNAITKGKVKVRAEERAL